MKELLKRILLAGCGLAIAPVPPAGEQKQVVVSQLFQSVMFLPLYVVLDRGFFEKQGLAMTKQTSGSPNALLSAAIATPRMRSSTARKVVLQLHNPSLP
ncbi:putative ABC transporter periplasmic protein [Agrobacterium tumefaciens str. Cherry 2E-2-2]|uniref:SsuA/THI5-like domain-containing protein n=2 Tax=Agrobacterium TaxID=357 RepID=A0A1S7R9G3_9HYPH|nr:MULTISPECIES: hypothetical protein [Agrobacterium]EMS97479.1 putative ABC transporter periplasmic protein [Agrobacterium tumefaciens str. Cherry 2E-2-2]CUX17174.1 exported hypothetical protein [Agrobacterium tumefaciens str. Kerr 14]CUX49124.1 exported hypothetical protein [Agrobacterium deltaense Zutra 3/1]